MRRNVHGRRLGQRQRRPLHGHRDDHGPLDGNTISFEATRASDNLRYALNGPISETLTLEADALIAQAWFGDGTPIDTSPNDLEFLVSKTTTNTSSYKNHGEYVKAMGGGADAAHSCIGMPIH